MKRENPSIEICPGITRRTIANGKTMYQMIATAGGGESYDRVPERTARRAITNRHIYSVAADAS